MLFKIVTTRKVSTKRRVGKQTAEYTKWGLCKETIYCCVQQSWILASILYNTISQNSIYWGFPSLSIFKRQNKSILRKVPGWWECDSLLLLQHVQSPMFNLYHIKTWYVSRSTLGVEIGSLGTACSFSFTQWTWGRPGLHETLRKQNKISKASFMISLWKAEEHWQERECGNFPMKNKDIVLDGVPLLWSDTRHKTEKKNNVFTLNTSKTFVNYWETHFSFPLCLFPHSLLQSILSPMFYFLCPWAVFILTF